MRYVLVGVALLLALLTIADRVAAGVADREVAKRIRTALSLSQTPGVSIHGFPFLTQAVAGHYDDVTVTIASVDAGPLRHIGVDARLQGVRASLSDLLGGHLNQVPVQRVSGALKVAYADLARASGISGLAISGAGNGLVAVSGQVQAFGLQVQANGHAAVSVDNGDLLVTVSDVQVNGVQAPAALRAEVARLLSFRVSPRGLPLALRITGVTTGSDSISVTAEATAVVIRPGQLTGVAAGG